MKRYKNELYYFYFMMFIMMAIIYKAICLNVNLTAWHKSIQSQLSWMQQSSEQFYGDTSQSIQVLADKINNLWNSH